MRQVADREATGAARWSAGLEPAHVAGTWILFLVALPFLEGETFSIQSLIVGGLIGAVIIPVGFMAASRVRPTLDRPLSAQIRLVLFAIVTGVGISAWHIGSNLILANLNAEIYARLVVRFVERPEWGSTFTAAVVEEVGFRLFTFSVVAWLAFLLVGQRRVAFWVGLLISATVFSVPHLWGRPSGGEGAVAVAYEGLILFNSGLAGCVLGWVFWRWGLLQAMVCHFTVNTMVLLVGPLVLS